MRAVLVLCVATAVLTGCEDRTCQEGLYRTHEGECVELGNGGGKAPMPEFGETLPPCERLPAGEELDLINGCVEGACVNQTLAELETSFGEAADCSDFDAGVTSCEFRGGTVGALFDDSNNDGIPDDPTEEAFGLHIDEGYAGSSLSGLGMGVSLRCFLEDFVAINDIETNQVDGNQQIVEVFFDNPSMFVHDDYFSDFDGHVTYLSIYGP